MREFLRGAAELYDLHVYTMGAKAYAAQMVPMLDPDGSLGLLHADRVIAKEDSTAAQTKSLDVLLGSERTAIILDDSPAVWPQQAAQLLVPRRYHFFASSASRDSSLPPGHPPHLLSGKDEAAEGGQLHAMLGALRAIHAEYFKRLEAQQGASADAAADAGRGGLAKPPHVADAVRAVRRRVLAGKTIVFSHVIPLQQQKQPESHPAYRLGTELGASIANSVGPTVTHIVAGSNGAASPARLAHLADAHAIADAPPPLLGSADTFAPDLAHRHRQGQVGAREARRARGLRRLARLVWLPVAAGGRARDAGGGRASARRRPDRAGFQRHARAAADALSHGASRVHAQRLSSVWS